MRPLFTAAFVSLIALAACDAPAPGTMTVSEAGMARIEQAGLDAVAPAVTPQVAVNTFAQYCAPFPANPRGTRAAIERDGYQLFVSASTDGLDMFVSPDGGPVVGTGRRDGAEICMVMMKEGRDLSASVASFVRQAHGANALQLPAMQTPEGVAENVWVAQTTPPIIYFTLVQNQPGLGRIEAIAQVTE